MYVFGINLPLVEILLFLVILFIFAIVYFAIHLKKLESMTKEEVGELQELEKMAEEDKKIETDLKDELEHLRGVETKEEEDITKFEQDMGALEESTETLYLKRLIPDVYKLQNYVLWALKKGIPAQTIIENLAKKGWSDTELVNMIIKDMANYVAYYKKNKKDIKIPDVKYVPVVTNEFPADEEKPEPFPVFKPKKKSAAKKKQIPVTSVEAELKELEADLRKSKPKKKPAKSKAKSKKPAKTKSSKAGKTSVIAIDGNEDFDVDVRLK